jgi:hypothetical protein
LFCWLTNLAKLQEQVKRRMSGSQWFFAPSETQRPCQRPKGFSRVFSASTISIAGLVLVAPTIDALRLGVKSPRWICERQSPVFLCHFYLFVWLK